MKDSPEDTALGVPSIVFHIAQEFQNEVGYIFGMALSVKLHLQKLDELEHGIGLILD
jgi:hypothetical protein